MSEILIYMMFAWPLAGALGVLLVRTPRVRNGVAVGAGFGAAFSAGLMAIDPQPGYYMTIFTLDGMSVMLAAVAAGIGWAVIIFSIDYMRGEKQLGRYYALVLIFIAAMCGLVITDSLLLLFICWEITALCSFALIAFHNDNPLAVRAGIRALMMTQLGGLGLLAGVLLLRAYLASDSIAYAVANRGFVPAAVQTVIAFGFILAAAAKSAQFPFHSWLAGAMEAPTPISALIHAATMVNAGVYLLARFAPAFESVAGWSLCIVLIGAISALIGALMALGADDLKRVLAYSTVSQLGYMMVAVGVGDIYASQFHLMNHAIFKALLFLSAGAVIHAAGSRQFARLGGLGAFMPLTRIAFAVGSLALVGVPILNGFWSKDLILERAFEHSLVVGLVLLMTAGITALYTVRMFALVFMGESHTDSDDISDAGPAMLFALVPLAAGALVSWIIGDRFAWLLAQTLPYHEIHFPPLMSEILLAPLTLAALFVIGVSAALWSLHENSVQWGGILRPFDAVTRSDFGLTWVEDRTVILFRGVSHTLTKTQTGSLNWNALMIFGALVAVLMLLWLGGIS